MRILTVSDVESKYLYEHYKPGKLSGYDLIISCGDVSAEYLEFLVTMAECPLLYVHGNHDDYPREPEGCICIDDRVYVYKGVRIMGLGGSYRYRDGKYMYTERQMLRRAAKLRYKLRKARGLDILVTHAPARHINDFETLPHRGFECFKKLIDRYCPRYFIHGHVHRCYGRIPQRSHYGDTTVINAYDRCVIELEEG